MLALDATAGVTSPEKWAREVVEPALTAVKAWRGDSDCRLWSRVLAELSHAEPGFKRSSGAVAYGRGCVAVAATGAGANAGRGKGPASRGAPPLQSILAAAGGASGGPVADPDAMLAWRKYRCDVCERTVDGPGEWQVCAIGAIFAPCRFLSSLLYLPEGSPG